MGPSNSDQRFSLTIALQIDEVCDRFESAWQAATRGADLNPSYRPRIEDFLVGWQDEQRATLLQELLAIEIRRRSDLGETPAAAEYQTRFPDAADFLANFFATVSESTDRLPSDETVGDRLPSKLGKYRILKPLGGGGFGNVYLAQDTELQRKVALKVPRPERIRTPADAERFLAEAQILAKLKHPNIVTVFDAGRSGEGIFFVVSELIEGSDLSKLIRRQRLAHRDSAELIAQIADALQHAHGQKLIHRDVKPANILIDSQGKPYLTDFGLALSDEHFGKETSMAGTPHYMSPEQARGEGHLVDGRSDMFSLGVVFYELLTGDRPFRGTWEDVLDQIRTLEPRPPRQLDPTIPKELERICLKAISKRASDRYTATLDMADDLEHFLETTRDEREGGREPVPVLPPETFAAGAPGPPRIVPKGLRSFDELDADFFLELLPGPRDREGLPEVIRFWKRRVEARDADHTFRVGLIYGPSGSGKSSLVKAGLIPQLSEEIIPVYLELSGLDDDRLLLANLRKKIPSLPAEKPLVETLADLRRGRGVPPGKKVLILLDQFEQWLHRNIEPRNTDLVAALRQCDGQHVQCILLARDDFWMATTRFMHEVDVPIIERGNSAAVDLFDPIHGRKVLAEFGRAFGRLPQNPGQLSKEQEQFLDLAIAELTREGKIVPVRLALFADIVRGKLWTPTTLKSLGGTQGVTITFLEETFGADTAPPEHRLHQKAARAVLQSLLPEGDADIKGHMRSHTELLEVSGYQDRSKRFTELMRILDTETRLLTPVEPRADETAEPDDPERPARPAEMFYHLTHDHLIQPLREWLTAKERATRRGRARLLLAERADQWSVKPVSRQLPTWWEYGTIRLLTSKAAWSPPEARMMRAGAKRHWIRAILIAFVAIPLLLFTAQSYANRARNRDAAERYFLRLTTGDTPDAMKVIEEIDDPRYRKWILPKLVIARNDTAAGPQAQVHIKVALIKLGEATDEDVADVVEHMLKVYRDASRNQRERDLATTILTDYAIDDAQTLADMLLDADESQFYRVFNALDRHNDSTISFFEKVLERTPPADYEAKDIWAKQQANAAIALLGWDRGNAAWQMLRHSTDPSRRSYLIHRMGPLGVDVDQVLARLETEADISARRALILSLGEFPETAVTESERSAQMDKLLKWYRDPTDPGLHAAAEWLLRKWGQDDKIAEVVGDLSEDETDDKDASRKWYVNSQGQTMVVLAPSAPFLYGSPPGPDVPEWEEQVIREIRRVFAISAKEVTVAEYLEINSEHEDNYYKEYARSTSCPINAASWFDAATYCNRLSKREGIPDEELCFIIHDESNVELPDDYLQRRGYRLPTEAEFEYACRAETQTVRYYGDTDELLRHYEWYSGSHYDTEYPVSMSAGLLKPNDFGLFDMLGNVAEWCQERQAANGRSKVVKNPLDVEDPGVVKREEERAMRAGKFSDVAYALRCAHRTSGFPATGYYNTGFRIVRTIESESR